MPSLFMTSMLLPVLYWFNGTEPHSCEFWINMEGVDLEGNDPQITPPPNTLLPTSGKVRRCEVVISDTTFHIATQDVL